MSIVLEGTIVPGFGRAKGFLQKQRQYFAVHFPEIQNACGRGTINVQLDQPLRVNNPHHATHPIPWNGLENPPEIFSFLRIELECLAIGTRRKAWIYKAHNSRHYLNLFLVELIAADRIPEIAADVRCRLYIADQHSSSEVVII